jgi:hypothetical protein
MVDGCNADTLLAPDAPDGTCRCVIENIYDTQQSCGLCDTWVDLNYPEDVAHYQGRHCHASCVENFWPEIIE